jgi:hypothetical protein
MVRSRQTVLRIVAGVLLAGVAAVAGATSQSEKSTGTTAPTSAAEKADREKKLAEATETLRGYWY